MLLSEDKSKAELDKWHKEIEMIGIEIKGIDEQPETGRFELKTRFINQHFINELDKIGLRLINIRGTFAGRLIVLLEDRNLNSTST
jgi:2,3-bisphosphoglycerate-independent phosphoglycerate mutase